MRKLNSRPLPVYSFVTSSLLVSYLKNILLVLVTTMSGLEGWGQADGDFQTKNATGNWSNYLSWNIRNSGLWVPALAGQIPNSTSSVFVQASNAITVDVTTAICNDLNFTSNGVTDRVILSSGNILTIYGNIIQAGTNVVPFPSFGAGAKIVFAGAANQTITNSSINTNLNNVEINKNGGIFTLPPANTSFTVFTLTAGTLTGAPGSSLMGTAASSVNINGGNWTQIANANRINGGSGIDIPISINGGTMTLATTSITGFNFSDIAIINGGVLNLNNFTGNINITNSLSIDANSIFNNALTNLIAPPSLSFLGTINYTHLGPQSIINSMYGNLGLAGSGNKNPSANLNITGNLAISGTAVLPLGSLTASIGGNWTNYDQTGFTESTSTVDFNGAGAQSINTIGGEDFFKVTKSGPGTLTLNSDVRLGGTASELNISNGIIDAGTYTFSGTGSTALTMSAGTLKLAKLNITVPEFTIATGYALTGGTIELSGAGTQILRGARDYRNLHFSNSGSKTISTATPSVTGLVSITDAAILDVSNNTFGGAATSLTMTGGRFRVSGTSTKPEIDGNFLLSGNSVIEFYNSGTAANETIKGKNGASNDILYNQVEVTGNKVGNSSSNITLNTNGIFTVKPGGIFEINDNSIIAATATTGQSVVVESNGTVLCGNNQGFNGFTSGLLTSSSVHANITNLSLGANSTINYTRAGDQPVTNANSLIYGNVILSGSGIKTAPSSTLTLLGNLIKSGTSTFEANAGTVLLNGVTQSFAGLTYNNLLLDNSGTKTLAGSAIVLDSVRIGNPGSNPATILELGNNDLTLRSTVTKTASIATIAPAVSINYTGTGRFVIERFFRALRSWRVITLPLTAKGTTGTSIFDTWQNGGVYVPGRGMFVTGPGASNPTPGPDGLDWSALDNYSLKRFAKNSYTGVGKTKDSTLSGNLTDTSANIGYFAFVRGDRNRSPNNTVVPNSNVTTLSGKGKLQTGRQTFHVNTDSLTSFTLVGNPYACAVDFNRITKNNVYPQRFIAYDPTINEVGVFVIMEDGGSGTFVPVNVPSTQNNFIQSGQAFFVQPNSTSAPADLVFNETNKSVTGINLNMFRPQGNQGQSFKTILNKLHADNTTSLADGVHFQLDELYYDGIDLDDALKFDNVAENLAILSQGRKLAVEKRAGFTQNDTLQFHLNKTTQRNYQFEFRPDVNTPGLEGYLEDSYTQASSMIDLSRVTTYNFSISSDSASAAPGRFKMIFKTGSGGPLAVTYTSVKAWQTGSSIKVEWVVENETATDWYEVEKSSDGINFIRTNRTPGIGANGRSTIYNWIDHTPFAGINYYRIRSVDRDGNMDYSRIVKVSMHISGPGFISIYPNPIRNNIIEFKLGSLAPGIYSVKLINSAGQSILSKKITRTSGASTLTVSPDFKLAAGIYQLEIMTPRKTISSSRLVVQ